METPKVSFEGTLEKTSGVFKNKTKVWMVLNDLSLTYYKNNKRSSCIGSIDMVTVQTVTQKKTMGGGKKFEIITATNTYHFEAESSELCEAWVKVLQHSMALKSTLSGQGFTTTQEPINVTSTDRSSDNSTKERPSSSSIIDELESLPSSPTVFGVKLKSTRHSRKSCDSLEERAVSPSSPVSPQIPKAQVDKPKSKFHFGPIGKKLHDNKDKKKRKEETPNKVCDQKQGLDDHSITASSDSLKTLEAKSIVNESEKEKTKDAADGSAKTSPDVNDDVFIASSVTKTEEKLTANNIENVKQSLPKPDTEKENLRDTIERSAEGTMSDSQQLKTHEAGLNNSNTNNVENDQANLQIDENTVVLENSVNKASFSTENSEIFDDSDQARDTVTYDSQTLVELSAATECDTRKGSDHSTEIEKDSENNADNIQLMKCKTETYNGGICDDISAIKYDQNLASATKKPNKSEEGILTEDITEHPLINSTENNDLKERSVNIENEIQKQRQSKNDSEVAISDTSAGNYEQKDARADEHNLNNGLFENSINTMNDTELKVDNKFSADENKSFGDRGLLNQTSDSEKLDQYQSIEKTEMLEVTFRQTSSECENMSLNNHALLNQTIDSENKNQHQNNVENTMTEVSVESPTQTSEPAPETCEDNDTEQVQMRRSDRDETTRMASAENVDNTDISHVEMRKSSRSRSRGSNMTSIECSSEKQTDSSISETKYTDSSSKLERLKSLKDSMSISDSEKNADSAKQDESEDTEKQYKLENLNSLFTNGDIDDAVFSENIASESSQLNLDAYVKLTAFVKQVDKTYDVEYHRLSTECPIAALEEMLSIIP